MNAPQKILLSVADLKKKIGQEIGVSPWHVVSQDMIYRARAGRWQTQTDRGCARTVCESSCVTRYFGGGTLYRRKRS